VTDRTVDDLARRLAAPMPRRRVLKLVGAALALASLPSFRGAKARAAEAAPNKRVSPSGRDLRIIDPPEGPFGSPVECGDPQRPITCNPTSNCVKCCRSSLGGGSCCPCYRSCRTTGSGRGDKQVACPPDGRPFCGPPGHCCAPNESCWKGAVCIPICKPDEQLCVDECCSPKAECITAKFPGSPAKRICFPKCPAGRTRCGVTACCKRGQKCLNPNTGHCSPCDEGQQPCGKKCCARGSKCCDPRIGLCCNKTTQVCAGYGGTAKCCPKGRKACTDGSKTICCGKDEVCAQMGDESGTVPASLNFKRECCPKDRQVVFESGVATCCPPGYKSLGGRFILPPFGGGGLCCRADRVCGSGASLTCCGAAASGDPALTSTCCNGTCVNTYFDAANCGACGAVCAPGQRCQAGACVTA
jgi:hypothetical protein